jgi:hypothetical protein
VKYLLLGLALGAAVAMLKPAICGTDDANLKEVSVDWVNQYNGKAPTLAACDDDAVGFYNALGAKGWTKVSNWGDNNAWETDFKSVTVASGQDANNSDNVDFQYFSGHGNYDGFYFGTDHTDWQAKYTDLSLGDKDLEFLTLSSCLCLNFQSGALWNKMGWPVFHGLHLICGMDTVEADTPSIGLYFVRFMTGDPAYPSYGTKLPVAQAWRYAGYYALPAGQYVAILGCRGTGGDTWNDYLPGYGPVTADNNSPSQLWWIRYPC